MQSENNGHNWLKPRQIRGPMNAIVKQAPTIMSALCLIGATINSVVFLINLFGTDDAARFSSGFLAIFFLGLYAYYYWYGYYQRTLQLILGMGFTNIVIFMFLRGAIAGNGVWLLIFPLIVALFDSIRSSIIWAIIVIATFLSIGKKFP